MLVIFGALFFAWSPGLYRKGLLRLVPISQRQQVARGLDAASSSLQGWLLGQLVSMAVIGILTGVGLFALGVPMAFSLALIAGLLEFIPFLGPLLAAIPAVLIGFSVDASTALYVALLYFAVQQVESYLLMPLVQRWAVSLPPALGLFAGISFAALFGIPGLLFAVPIVVATLALIREWYVKPMEQRSSEIRGAAFRN